MTRPKQSTWRVTIFGVLTHTATIRAASSAEATDLANDRWKKNGDVGFFSQSLGRSETVITREEVQP